MPRRILVLNGPNLNLLGTREVDIYGSATLDDIEALLRGHVADRDVDLTMHQTNSEGGMVDAIQDARAWADGVVCNAGAYTHTSIALRDAVVGTGLPVVETHLSNVYARETFRTQSYLAAVSIGVVTGFGVDSYVVALDALLRHLDATTA